MLRWYARHGRDLPWRHTSEPYRILLSETMLQQTQVARVLEKYPAFLKRFPSFRALARAPRSAVVHAWSGMGYNNRAVRLHRLARRVMQGGGTLPRDPAALQRLPGIGAYTESFYEVTIETMLTLLFIGLMMFFNKTLYGFVQVTTAMMLCANVVALFIIPVMIWLTVSDDPFSYYFLFALILWDFALVTYIFK